MSLRNQLIYMQFHSVTYMIKLNIELFMIILIMKLIWSHDNLTQNNSDSHVINHYRQIIITLNLKNNDLHDDLKSIHAQIKIHILTENDNCQKKLKLSLQFSNMSLSENKLSLTDNTSWHKFRIMSWNTWEKRKNLQKLFKQLFEQNE